MLEHVEEQDRLTSLASEAGREDKQRRRRVWREMDTGRVKLKWDCSGASTNAGTKSVLV